MSEARFTEESRALCCISLHTRSDVKDPGYNFRIPDFCTKFEFREGLWRLMRRGRNHGKTNRNT
jgi:hypothetical protein